MLRSCVRQVRIEEDFGIAVSEQPTDQQQQLLEAELSAKSKDLASMALGVFAKNEVLEKLRAAVQEFLVKGQYGRKNLESLLKLINENIETQEFWDVFQNNFDLIHEKFFRNLRERYPSLTATDLRFCALLRLNLSTKDIAQHIHSSSQHTIE